MSTSRRPDRASFGTVRRVFTWFQSEVDDAGVNLSGIIGQDGPLFVWDPQHDLWLPQRWFSSDHDAADGPLTGKRVTSSAYRSLVIADGATSYWRLNEPDNDPTPDASDWYTSYDEVNAREGMWVGGITNGRPSLLTGDPTDNAIALDGSATMQVPSANWFNVGLGDFSVEVWFKTSSATAQTFVSHKVSTATIAGWAIQTSATGIVQVIVSDGTTLKLVNTPAGPGINGLTHHVVLVRQGANLTGYLDGFPYGTVAGANLDATNAQPFTIGAYAGGTNKVTGDVDEVAVYTSALTGSQVANHYLVGTQGWAPSIEVDDATEQRSWNIAWFQPDIDEADDLVPRVVVSTPVNQQPLYDWDAVRDLWLPVRWYQEPDDALGFPVALDSLPAALEALYDWDAVRDIWRPVTWFQSEQDDWLGTTPFAPSSATVAQQPTNDWDGSLDRWQPIVWFRPDDPQESPFPIVPAPRPDQIALYDWDAQQDLDRRIVWFQEEGDALGLPLTTVQAAGQALYDWTAEQDRWLPIRWYQEPDDQLGIPAFAPSTATTAQQPLYDWDASQDRPLVLTWFQPDDPWDGNFQFQQITTATVAQQPLYQLDAPDLWLPVRWYQEPDDALGIPPFAASSATVAAQPLYGWEPTQDAWITSRWYQPEDGWENPRPIIATTTATVAQQAGLWIEQPYPLGGTAVRWFQPDLDDARGNPPLATTATVAQQAGLFGWDAASDRWLPVRWYQEPDDELGLVPQNLSVAAANQQPLYDWDAGQDRWAPIAWSQEGHLSLDFSLPTAPTVPQEAGVFGWDAQADQWNPIRWFSPDDDETGFFQPITTVATAAQQPLYGYDAGQDQEVRPRWFDLPDDALVPFVQTVNTYSVADYDPQQDRSSSIRWYQEPDDTVGLYPTTANAAQNVGGYDPGQDVSTAQRWVQPDVDDALGIPPFAATTPTTAQLAALFGSDPQQERALQPVWYQEPDQNLGTLFAPVGFAANQTPAFDYDPQQDRLTAPVWFHPEDDASGIATTSSTTAQQVIQGEFHEIWNLVRWYQELDDTNGTPAGITRPTVAQLAAILGDETHQQDRSIQPTWYQEPDPSLGNVSGIFAGPPGPPYVRISNAGPSLTASDASKGLAVSSTGSRIHVRDISNSVLVSDASPHVDVEDHLGQ